MSEQKNQQKQPPKRATSGIFAILMALLLLILGQQGILPLGDTADAPDALPTATIAAALTDSPTSAPTQAPQQTAITAPQDIADYIFAHGTLPDASGRKWYEADANYTAGPRGAERILYSSDGLVYYTSDHYQTFTEMHPSGK